MTVDRGQWSVEADFPVALIPVKILGARSARVESDIFHADASELQFAGTTALLFSLAGSGAWPGYGEKLGSLLLPVL